MFNKLNSEEQINILSLAGPLFFLLTLTAIPMSGILAIPVAIAFILAAKWKTKGLILAVPLLALTAFWNGGLLTSSLSLAALSSAAFITALASSEVESFWKKEQQSSSEKLEEFQKYLHTTRFEADHLRKESEEKMISLSKAFEEAKARVESYKRLTDLSQNEIEKLRGQNEKFVREAFETKRQLNELHEVSKKQIIELQEHNKKLLDDLNHTRVDRLQWELLATLPVATDSSSHEADFLQLRKQFAEKTQVLDQTRKELFHTENVLLSMKKEVEHRALEPNEETLALQKQIAELAEECRFLEDEVRSLEELIATLIAKKRSSPKKELIESN